MANVKPGDLSTLDFGGILRHVHDADAAALRIVNANSQVPQGYSRVEFTKNLAGSIIKAVFYKGTQAEKTRVKFVGDVAGSLSGKYWTINTAEDVANIYVWYNDGSAIDPAIVGKIGLEIPYTQNDSVAIITLLTKRYLETLLSFRIETNGDNVLLIENTVEGETTNSTSGTSPFNVTTTNEGVTKRYKTVELPEDPDIKYIFNYGERRFEISQVLTISGSVDANIVSPLPLPTTIDGLTVSVPNILNIPAPVAGTEYTFTIAAGVKRFEIGARGIAKIQLAKATGESGTKYRTISPGVRFKEECLVLTSPFVYYFQTNKDNEVLEIVTYS